MFCCVDVMVWWNGVRPVLSTAVVTNGHLSNSMVRGWRMSPGKYTRRCSRLSVECCAFWAISGWWSCSTWCRACNCWCCVVVVIVDDDVEVWSPLPLTLSSSLSSLRVLDADGELLILGCNSHILPLWGQLCREGSCVEIAVEICLESRRRCLVSIWIIISNTPAFVTWHPGDRTHSLMQPNCFCIIVTIITDEILDKWIRSLD